MGEGARANNMDVASRNYLIITTVRVSCEYKVSVSLPSLPLGSIPNSRTAPAQVSSYDDDGVCLLFLV